MSDYKMSDVRTANETWKEKPWADMVEEVDVPDEVLDKWADMGIITSAGGYHFQNLGATISRVDELYDAMPLPQIAEWMDLPLRMLYDWAKMGWISTDEPWDGKVGGRKAKASTRTVVESYFERDEKTYKDVGEELGIAESTVAYHMKKYRNGDL